MAASRKIRIMISSRCNDGFPAGTKASPALSVVRKELKREIEAQELFGEKRFEVWINAICFPYAQPLARGLSKQSLKNSPKKIERSTG